MLDNVRGNFYCPYKHCKNEKKYHTDDVLRSYLIKHGFIEYYRCWNKYGEERLNKIEIRDSYVERKVPTGVEEDHNDMNDVGTLGFTDDDIEFHVHNIGEMVHNVERHVNDDQYSNDKLVKYKKMIKDFKKSFYHGCVAQYMRLFMMVKLFQLKVSNRWITWLSQQLAALFFLPEEAFEWR
jgi:hypothetical protein